MVRITFSWSLNSFSFLMFSRVSTKFHHNILFVCSGVFRMPRMTMPLMHGSLFSFFFFLGGGGGSEWSKRFWLNPDTCRGGGGVLLPEQGFKPLTLNLNPVKHMLPWTFNLESQSSQTYVATMAHRRVPLPAAGARATHSTHYQP